MCFIDLRKNKIKEKINTYMKFLKLTQKESKMEIALLNNMINKYVYTETQDNLSIHLLN